MPETLVFGADDLRRCRFALSPLWETLAAVHLLFEPQRHGFHLPWVQKAALPTGTDLTPLRLLAPRPGYTPDFLSPPPTGTGTSIDGELDRVAATPVDQVTAELKKSLLDPVRRLEPGAVEPLLDDPGATRDRLVVLLRTCWNAIVSPYWARLRALLEADIARRSHALTDGGLERMVAELHPSVEWEDDRLSIGSPGTAVRHLDGEGVLLMPSAFVWPDLVLISDPPWQPTLIYPARGIGDLWSRTPRRPPRALTRLLGRTRAALLLSASDPATTTSFAAQFDLGLATVSANLVVLRDSGLLTSWRVGRRVFYGRTAMGDALVSGVTGDEDGESRSGSGRSGITADPEQCPPDPTG